MSKRRVKNIMKKEKVAIYPFSKEDMILIRYLKEMYPFEIIGLVSAKGSGLVFQDVGYADNREEMGIRIRDDISPFYELADAIFITSGEMDDNKHKHTVETIIEAISRKKKVYCTLSLSQESIDRILKVAIYNEVDFVYLASNNTYDRSRIKRKEGVFRCSVPIILIGGTTLFCNAFEIMLGILFGLRSKKIRVSAFTSNKYAKSFNLNYISGEIFEKAISPESIIAELNEYLYYVYKYENPEVILLHAPDSILRFSETVPDGYGIKTYMVSQAMCPDYAVACLHSYCDLVHFVDFLNEDISIRLGAELVAVHLSNVMLDYVSIGEYQRMDYVNCSLDDVDEQIQSAPNMKKHMIINGLKENEIRKLVEWLYSIVCLEEN